MFPGCLNQTPFNVSSLQWGQMLTYFSSFSGMSQSVAGQLSHPRWRQCFPPSSSHCSTLPLKSSIPHTNSFSWSYTKSLHVLFDILLSNPMEGGRQATGERGRSCRLGGWIFLWREVGKKEKGSKTSFVWHWGATRVASLPVWPQPSSSCFTFFVSYFCCNWLQEKAICSLLIRKRPMGLSE